MRALLVDGLAQSMSELDIGRGERFGISIGC